MESIYLRTLVEVARTGNITKAAESLHVTQSAVSRRIKFLEDQYGQPLLDRSGPLLGLNPAGRVVLEKAQKILEIEREILSSLLHLERRKGLSFVCTPTFGIVHLPDVLREFMLRHADAGDLKFVFEMPEKVLAGVREGLFELAVVEHCACFDVSGFESVNLAGDEMVFAASPSLGLALPEVTLDEVFRRPLFTRSEGCCSRSLLENNLRALGRGIDQFHRLVVYDDLHVIVESLVRGEGIAFISTELIRAHVEEGRLREYRVPGFTHLRRRTLVMGASTARDDLMAEFVRCVLARVGAAEPSAVRACS